MSNLETIRSAIADFAQCIPIGRDFAVPTQYLFPSNGAVTVYVMPALVDSFIVTDKGAALDELSASGIYLDNVNRFLGPICKKAGLETKAGEILTKPLPVAALTSGIIFVASTSSEAAYRGLETFRPKARRDLSKDVQEQLSVIFAPDRIKQEGILHGASSRQYRFDFVVNWDGDKKLVIDAVSPDSRSVNAKAAAHLDLSKLDKPEQIEQRLVYDDSDEWDAADLNFLQMVARTVPVGRLGEALKRGALH